MSWEIGLIMSLVTVVFSLLFVSSKLGLDQKHFVLKLIFLGVGMGLLLVVVNSGGLVMDANNSTIDATAYTKLKNEVNLTFNVVTRVLIIGMFYLFVVLILGIFDWWIKFAKNKGKIKGF